MVGRMTILALDLGTTCGWALRDSAGQVISGSQSFKPGRYDGGGMRYLRFTRWLDEIAKDAKYIAFEEVRRHAGTDAAHVYGGFMATLMAWCELRGIPCEGIPVQTIKKHATGKGNASKEQMIAAMIGLGHDPHDDNEADAIAMLYYAVDAK
jgi:Holliday junction resolvasome RuvABC endonuclease subunit